MLTRERLDEEIRITESDLARLKAERDKLPAKKFTFKSLAGYGKLTVERIGVEQPHFRLGASRNDGITGLRTVLIGAFSPLEMRALHDYLGKHLEALS